jgi:hypothetical protein
LRYVSSSILLCILLGLSGCLGSGLIPLGPDVRAVSLSVASTVYSPGAVVRVRFAVNTGVSPLERLSLSYAPDGANFFPVESWSGALAPAYYDWTAPAVATESGVLRIVAISADTHELSAVSPAITIDSTAPPPPPVVLLSAANANSPVVRVTILTCGSSAKVLTSESAVRPLPTDKGFNKS